MVLAFPARHFVDAVDSFKRGASRSIGGVQLQVHPLFLDNHCRSELFGSGAGACWAREVVQTPGHARRLAGILRLRFAWVALGALFATEVVPGGHDPESTAALSRGSGSGDLQERGVVVYVRIRSLLACPDHLDLFWEGVGGDEVEDRP